MLRPRRRRSASDCLRQAELIERATRRVDACEAVIERRSGEAKLFAGSSLIGGRFFSDQGLPLPPFHCLLVQGALCLSSLQEYGTAVCMVIGHQLNIGKHTGAAVPLAERQPPSPHHSICQSIGAMPAFSRSLFVFEKCLQPKKPLFALRPLRRAAKWSHACMTIYRV